MNMTNTFYLTGKVKSTPSLKEYNKTVMTHVKLSTSVKGKESVFTLIAFGNTAKKLAQLKANSTILTNLSVEDRTEINRATGKHGWKTQLTINDFSVLTVETNNCDAEAAADAKMAQKRQDAINNVIFNEFLS